MCEIEINIMDVVRKNGIKITGKSGNSLRCECPFCGGQATMGITPSRNLYSCFRCNKGGNHVSLEYELNPLEYSGENKYPLFVKNMEEFISGGCGTTERETFVSYASRPEGIERASDEECSAVNYALLRLLDLKPEHKADLLKRGLTEDDIKRFKFRSSPTKRQKYSIPKALIEAGYDLEGVPPFYKEGKRWAMNTPPSSYLCGAWDGHKNQLLGFQPRLDNPINGNKYLWLSSTGKPSGCSSGTLASILPGSYDDAIIIVEGTLKAMVVYCLLKGAITVVSVPGVNSIKCLEPVLEYYEGKVAFECYDMDKFFEKPILAPKTEEEEQSVRKVKNIQSAIVKLESKCSDYNIGTHHMTWNFISELWAEGETLTGLSAELPEYALTGKWTGKGKGLDDFLLEYGKPEVFVNYVITKAKKLNAIKKFTQ